MRPRWSSVCLLALAILPLGCGGGNTAGRLPTVSVSGSVTLDGKTFGPGTVEFISAAQPGTPARNGIGRVSSSGSFRASSYSEGDGGCSR